jgi:hypothetical protein
VGQSRVTQADGEPVIPDLEPSNANERRMLRGKALALSRLKKSSRGQQIFK